MRNSQIISVLNKALKIFNKQVDIEGTEQFYAQEQNTYLAGYNQAIRDVKKNILNQDKVNLQKKANKLFIK